MVYEAFLFKSQEKRGLIITTHNTIIQMKHKILIER